MKPHFEEGAFVHVVATVDLDARSGTIRYVNPSSASLVTDAAPDPRVELAALDGDGQEIGRQAVPVRRSSGEPGRPNNVGLIQADVPRTPEMAALALFVDGAEVARYEAGAPPAGAGAGPLNISAGAAPNRLNLGLSALEGMQVESGVSYTIQVMPDNSGAWSTIAVGRTSPAIALDRNQFPGATSARVRVLRTNGFEEEVVAEEDVDLRTG